MHATKREEKSHSVSVNRDRSAGAGSPAERRSSARLVALALLVGALSGCKSGGESANWLLNGFLDPTQQGQFLEPRRNEIRASLSILEEPIEIQDADDPRTEDLVADFAEHVVSPGDVLSISIFELLIPGQATTSQVLVGRSGFESLPTIGRVRMAGMTLSGLEMELKSMLRERDILPDPEVQVALVATRATRFSIIGSVSRPGTYDIPQPEYRLLQAIADSGGVSPLIPRVYVFRNGAQQVTTAETTTGSSETSPGILSRGGDPAGFFSPSIGRRGGRGVTGRTGWYAEDSYFLSDVSGGATSAPTTGPSATESPAIKPSTTSMPESASQPDVVPGGAPVEEAPSTRLVPPGVVDELEILEGSPTSEPQSITWDPNEGWVIKPLEESAASTSSSTTEETGGGEGRPLESMADSESSVRIIEVPTKELLAGDPRYNIVIRPFDLINIPPGTIGEYYMMGNVTRPGAYDITGRRLTVKEAIAAAGGFGPLAWPSRADLIRRVSQDEEQVIQLDLDAIFAGNAPDFYLRPNDIVNVGTSPAALFLAVLRNAFRFSYGFGFVYDRNFADSDTFQAREQVRQRRIQEAQLKGVPLQ